MVSSAFCLYLLLAAVSYVHCVELTQTDSIVLKPGEVLTLSCKISGYSVTDGSYWTHWIRQAAGKALEWIGQIGANGYTNYNDKLNSRFILTKHTSSNTETLSGQNMQTEDTAVYYCARERYHRDTKHKQLCSKTESVNGQSLESIPSSSVTKKPGETLNLSCKGSGFDFGQYGMHWIRQPAGKALDWIGVIWYDASKTVYAKSVEGRIEITRDNSNNMVYLKLSGLKTEDSAVYYCARYTQ
nr:uncharacterized protein ighv4-5 [Danio rerio]|eukprot:XP_009297896.1 uncharacterized protein ighv4-5 [Danio rerio]